MRKNNRYSELEHVPACSTWPPPWLASSTPAPSTSIEPTPSTLSQELRECWEERVSIMHHDGGLPLQDAEQSALAAVLNLYGEGEDIRPIRG